MIQIPEVKLVDVNKIVEDKTNPNVMSDKNFDALKEVIKKYGFLVPIITNQNFKIADGFHRWKAACELEIEKIPTIVLDVKEVDRRILRQVMNKLRGEHDEDLDIQEFLAINESGDIENLINLLPDSEKDVMNALKTLDEEELGKEEFIEVDAYERAKKLCKIKIGDMFELGPHRLICGDATKTTHVNNLMDGSKADMVFTDPPYGNDLGYGRGQIGERYIAGDKNTNVIRNSFKNLDNVLSDNSHCLVWIQWRTFSKLEKIFEKYKLRTVVVWDKRQAGLSGKGFAEQHEWICVFIKGKATQNEYSGNVWQQVRENNFKGRSEHPTKKPIEILIKAIKLCSQKKELILDLFGGSGSTLIAAEQSNRKCYMMELDPVYCQVIVDRWEKYTNKKAKKVS